MAKTKEVDDVFIWDDQIDVKDRTVYSFGLILQKMHAETTKLINSIGKQAIDNPLRQSSFVSMRILFRLQESMKSIETLVVKGLTRDAAILLISLIETRMEMEYIASNHAHADKWITETNKNKKPWKINFLIKELFPEKVERKKEKDNYKYCLKIKHGNPMGEQSDFQIFPHESDEHEELPAKGDEPDAVLLALILVAEGHECYHLFKAAVKDFAEAGFDVKANVTAIDELHELLEALQSLKKL